MEKHGTHQKALEVHGHRGREDRPDHRGPHRDHRRAEEGARRELEKLKAKPGDGFKAKYEQEHSDFEAYKAQVEEERATREKAGLYRAVLQEAGVDSKRIESVMRVADLSAISVKDGAIEDRDKVLETVKTDWADFIPQVATKPAAVTTPPANAGGDKEPQSLAEALRLRYQK